MMTNLNIIASLETGHLEVHAWSIREVDEQEPIRNLSILIHHHNHGIASSGGMRKEFLDINTLPQSHIRIGYTVIQFPHEQV